MNHKNLLAFLESEFENTPLWNNIQRNESLLFFPVSNKSADDQGIRNLRVAMFRVASMEGSSANRACPVSWVKCLDL